MRCTLFCLFISSMFAASPSTFTYTVPWTLGACCQDTNVNAIAIDADGNEYLAGSTRSPSFPATSGSFQAQSLKDAECYNPAGIYLMYTACYDAFVIKLSPAGSIVYAMLLGGNGNDIAYAVAVDSQGDAYIAGSTSPNRNNEPNTFPVTPDAAFPNPATAFAAKLDPSGSRLLFSTFLPLNPQIPEGAVLSPSGLAIAVDNAGSLYITCASASFSATPGTFQPVAQNPEGAGVMKLDPSGDTVVYATYLSSSPDSSSGNYFDVPLSIAIDDRGDAFIAGFTPSSTFPVTPGAYQTTFPGRQYAGFLAELNPQGTGLVYSTFLGSSSDSGPWAVRLDPHGSAWVLGQGNFPAGGILQSGPNTSMLAHVSPDGSSLIFSTYLPQANALDVDATGNVYVAGCLGSVAGGCPGVPNLPTIPSSFQPSFIGNGDGYAVRFDSDGVPNGATYIGGWENPQSSITGNPGNDTANLIAAARDGSVVIVGNTFSPAFPGIAPAPSPGQYPGVEYVIRIPLADRRGSHARLHAGQ